MTDAPVPEIQWFNTNYVTAEDRLRFTCTLKSGDTDVFWLTQRLAAALTGKLLDWLDKSVEGDNFPELAHQMAQRTATAAKTPPPKPALKPPSEIDKPGWLVDSVVLKSPANVLVLTFRDEPGDHHAFIRFDAQHLRRWLKVLHAQYVRSGWPTEIWPDWIRDAGKIKPGVQSGLLH